MLVRKEIIRKLVDQYYQVANYLIEDQLQAMQLIIDVATGASEEDESFLYKIDNDYFERQFLLRLISLATKRSQQTKTKGKLLNHVKKKACIYLFEIRGESVDNIAMVLNISHQEVLAYIDHIQMNFATAQERDNGRPLN
ncbi:MULTISPECIES: hypothetical protein [Halobacteriovorax]|uniref:RNA polymerase sigma factor 70 region 4 type 2 domain-containing protein n=1 Tax=Halobacteriovorax vibrionivorans TaxID=2152716 RepID=A0ABY0IHM4_9BACT|nr:MULTISPECIES: hypothetical protein [Halobacteriovorax]RZF22446.1 hypothetical protein DAY19_01355 [Halobacteriovorax vibrionivorans]TGD47637.1 hypothetical protein EP118_06715 [Halobacteriovorax sp. Y22]